MGNLVSNNSTKSTPLLYEGIKLFLADPEMQFPESFIRSVERVKGAFVVALEDFDPRGLQEEAPEEVELRDRETYIVVPREDKITEKRYEGIEVWQKNQISGDERMLLKLLMKELEKNHTTVRAWCKKELTGPNGWSREVDAAAIGDGCAIVVEHKTVMDSEGADQLTELIDEIDAYMDSGKGSVGDFSGLRIMGALAGPVETSNPSDLKKMNARLQRYNCYKWFEEKAYGDDPCSPFQALMLSIN